MELEEVAHVNGASNEHDGQATHAFEIKSNRRPTVNTTGTGVVRQLHKNNAENSSVVSSTVQQTELAAKGCSSAIHHKTYQIKDYIETKATP
ncbi:hypothetical protein ACFQ3K_06905 [Brucella gallinifaecis]|uniref:Uncharacterized protein n=1 Tax=Brucella gallinifaecis TaxID=215590 RepID=A0A502BIH3_9HYPH|nr:hypothetical protein [Brucella gallinifaecis]TPF74392.1 hypothetical protein FHY56_14885 [Brucella gallinifaecis]